MKNFAHLHVHTQYSLLDGAARINDLVKKAKEYGMTAMAITDHGAMYGVIEFYKACKEAGIKPIIGMEAYVAAGALTEKEGIREYSHLVLLCKNQTGYKNLIKLSSIAYTEGFYYKPRIDYDILEKYSEGLICLSACLAGDIPSLLLEGKKEQAYALAKRLKQIFNEDFYIEIQNHGLLEQAKVLPLLVELADGLDIKLAATNDVHYVEKKDAEAQDVLLCIQTNRFVDEENRMKMETEEFYLKSLQEMENIFFDYPQAISNTMEIADKCNVEIKFGERYLPEFTAPEGKKNSDYLRELCYEGLKREFKENISSEMTDRLDYELEMIEKMGFVDYFLIVWDFIFFAKSKGIPVGPGRGSGAGSLVAYCLGITGVNPLKYNLVFERFLNPERISMPDFDIDFCYERRQEVIDYVVDKYGKDRVAQIITFGSMAAKAAVRDVGRALHMPYGEVDRIAKLIPYELNITLDRAIAGTYELRELYETNDQVKKLLDLAKKLEGLPRHASTHAAGVVISAHPTVEYVPLQLNDAAVTTQFTMGTLEELGLLKMDFLGLRTLTVIQDALNLIAEQGGKLPDFENMEYEDKNVYEMISAGDTDGVFQLESAGMRQFLMQLKPNCFEDIIAGISLFRPGPMEQIPRYIKGKNDAQNIKYPTEKLRPILSPTYGCMVYQEQVMQIVRDLAGYSMGRSDLVRRAMSKKKHDVMADERKNFIHGVVKDGEIIVPGAIRNGISESVANKIFDEMMDFASYAFNKSHAAAYAVLAFQTAYLKYYHPLEFMTALINSFMGSTEKIAEYFNTCRTKGIKVLPPDINNSGTRFTIEKGAIRFGLAAIKNVGEAAVGDIIAKRRDKGKYRDFFDFIDRSDNLNKRMLEGMIKSGCFDGMNVRRSQLMAEYEKAMEDSLKEKKRISSGQISFFDAIPQSEIGAQLHQLPDIPEFTQNVLLQMEKESIGLFISGHPLLEYKSQLDQMSARLIEITEADGTGAIKDGDKVRVGGIISSMKTRATKSGSGTLGLGTIEDLTATAEILVFPTILIKYGNLLNVDSKVCISGRISMKEDQPNTIVVEEVKPLVNAGVTSRLYIKYSSGNAEQWNRLMTLLPRYPGNVPVTLHDGDTGKTKLVPRDMYVNASEGILNILKELVGEENVKIVTKEASEN